MTTAETPSLLSLGGPLFRKPGTSHEHFATAWHRHGRLCAPWCLNADVWEYIQIHMPPAPASGDNNDGNNNNTIEDKARQILLQADGVAIMRFRQDTTGPTETAKRYFEKVLADERRFLHVESGAGAVKGDPPVYDLPELHVDVWREMALGMGGVEYFKIRDGKDVASDAMWEQWEEVKKEMETKP